ncbi:MAG: hypothetical protein ACR2QE_20020 [Acidimicrobiales bacterium]
MYRTVGVLVTTILLLSALPAAAQAPERADRERVYVLHDSVMLSAKDEVRAALADHEVNFDGFGGFLVAAAPEIIARQRHLIDDIVVIELGTNYLGNPAFFRASVRRTLDALADVDRIVWVTPQRYRVGMDTVNAILDEEAWSRPNVELADWTAIAADPAMTWHPNDVHLTPAGQRRLADLVAGHVRGAGRYDDAPVGAVAARPERNGLHVRGWAADPDTPAPIDVHIWIDGRLAHSRRAGIERPDMAHLGYGTRHGYSYLAAVPDGPHYVCVQGVNAQSARTRFVGCTVVFTDNEPVGTAKATDLGGGRVEVKGWVFDPDGRRPIGAHLFVDGAFAQGRKANRLRLDVEAKFGNGRRHGFRFVAVLPAGEHELCVRGLNIRAGLRNPTIGCSTVTVAG